MKHALTIAGLVVLISLLDLLFRPIYAEVNLIRATLVGVTAYVVLFGVSRIKEGLVNPLVGALSIFSSAFFSVLLIQAGLLVSQSTISGIVHVVILALTYLVATSIAGRIPSGLNLLFCCFLCMAVLPRNQAVEIEMIVEVE